MADIRYAVRTLLRQPGFLMAAALLTLALGVGANTTIYSVMNATILRPLPFADASRLVLVWKTFGGGGVTRISFRRPIIGITNANFIASKE